MRDSGNHMGTYYCRQAEMSTLLRIGFKGVVLLKLQAHRIHSDLRALKHRVALQLVNMTLVVRLIT